MGKYLKKFETQSAYEAAQSSLILPNVSLTVDNNTIHYNPSTPPTPSYEYVDLGLPSGTLWARYNVGATSETEYGNYYQYGKGAYDYTVTSGDSNYSGTENPLAASADTASVVWGGDWHMPTSAQCVELTANTTYEYITDFNGSGINGGKFTAQNGNYIFIPAAGDYYSKGEGLIGVNEEGGILCSTNLGENASDCLYLTENSADIYGDNGRFEGYSVRAVMDV